MIQNKFSLMQDIDTIFNLKIGSIIKNKENNCYQTLKFISLFFKFYYYSGTVLFILIFMFLLMPHFFNNLWFQIFETLGIYIVLEILIFFIIPIKKVKC